MCIARVVPGSYTEALYPIRVTMTAVLMTLIKVVAALVLVATGLLIGGVLGNRPPLFDPPGLGKRLQVYFTTHVAELVDDPEFPELRAYDAARSPDELYAQTVQAVQRLGWDLAAQDAQQHTLSAVVTSRLWRFKDDVQIRIVAHADGSRLYARSASRVGRGDLGANARHLRVLLEELQRN